MIDEKKLIEEIKSFRMIVTGIRVGKGILREFEKHYKESILRIIDEQEKVGEWISANKRLPEEDGIYLVQLKSGNLYTCRYCEGWNCNRDHITGNVNRGLEVFTVVAWMPLPEPYRGEKV